MQNILYSPLILIKLVFSRQNFQKSSNFTKIHPPITRLFHEEGQTDRHGEADIHFRNFAKPPKIFISIILQLLLNIVYKLI